MARPIIDLRGRRFGRLTVPRDAQPSIRKRKAYWPLHLYLWAPETHLQRPPAPRCDGLLRLPAVGFGRAERRPAEAAPGW